MLNQGLNIKVQQVRGKYIQAIFEHFILVSILAFLSLPYNVCPFLRNECSGRPDRLTIMVSVMSGAGYGSRWKVINQNFANSF